MGKWWENGVQSRSKAHEELIQVPCSLTKLQCLVDTLIRIAKTSSLMHKHSACLMQSGKMCSVAVNKHFQSTWKNEPICVSIHAEIGALFNCNAKSSKGMDILVVRIGKSQKMRNSRPCNACIEKLQKKGIRKAYYSTDTGSIVWEFVDTMPKLHTSCGNRYKITKDLHNLCL
jgi:cytidine deaminase